MSLLKEIVIIIILIILTILLSKGIKNIVLWILGLKKDVKKRKTNG